MYKKSFAFESRGKVINKKNLTRRLLLVVMLLVIFQLSSTSFLKVVDPGTWFNPPEYENIEILIELLDTDSRFYESYFPTSDGIHYAGVNFFAHKASHMIAYGFLGILFLINLNSKKHIYKKAWLLVFITATLDEANQYLIIGRTGMFLDILLDVSSAFFVLFLFFVIHHLTAGLNQVKRHKKRRA